MPMFTSPARIDVREIASSSRQPHIFSALRKLGVSQTMEIVSDHDPKALYDQVQATRPGRFGWEDLEIGPDVWRVRITRLDSGPEGHCCGGCGGA